MSMMGLCDCQQDAMCWNNARGCTLSPDFPRHRPAHYGEVCCSPRLCGFFRDRGHLGESRNWVRRAGLPPHPSAPLSRVFIVSLNKNWVLFTQWEICAKESCVSSSSNSYLWGNQITSNKRGPKPGYQQMCHVLLPSRAKPAQLMWAPQSPCVEMLPHLVTTPQMTCRKPP